MVIAINFDRVHDAKSILKLFAVYQSQAVHWFDRRIYANGDFDSCIRCECTLMFVANCSFEFTKIAVNRVMNV